MRPWQAATQPQMNLAMQMVATWLAVASRIQPPREIIDTKMIERLRPSTFISLPGEIIHKFYFN